MNKLQPIDIPGKLFLAGEYGVTQVATPAIIAAVTKGMTLTIEPSQQESSVQSEGVDGNWQLSFPKLTPTLDEQWKYVAAALSVMADYLVKLGQTNLPQFQLRITSQMAVAGHKLGLGSSAAVVVGVVRALAAFYDLRLSALVQYKLAALAHLAVQGNGSLGDVAASTYGGVIVYQRPNPSFFTEKKLLDSRLAQVDWPNLVIQRLDWPTSWQLLLGATYHSADTKQALANNPLPADFYPASRLLVEQLLDSIQEKCYPALRVGLAANQALLTRSLPTAYQSQKLTNLLAGLNHHHIAGKISGAGFGDNGFAVVQPNSPVTALRQDWQAQQIHSEPLTIAPPYLGGGLP